MRLPKIRDEVHWLGCQVPRYMIQFLQNRTSDRKLRLWSCASCANWYGGRAEIASEIALAEAWVDGEGIPDWGMHHDSYVCFQYAWTAAYEGAVRNLERQASSDKKRQAVRFQLATIHDIFGNPFRPVALDPAWLTADVLALAKGIYVDRAFDRMPILADALQDAGCASDEVLNHCRNANQVHVRGCWVVDLLLGKA